MASNKLSDVVARFYEALAKRDAEGLSGLIDEAFAADAAVVLPESLPYGGTVQGKAALSRMFAALVGQPAPIGPDGIVVESLTGDDERVAAQLRFDWYAPGSSTAIPSGALELWQFENGVVKEMRAYYWDVAALVSATPARKS